LYSSSQPQSRSKDKANSNVGVPGSVKDKFKQGDLLGVVETADNYSGVAVAFPLGFRPAPDLGQPAADGRLIGGFQGLSQQPACAAATTQRRALSLCQQRIQSWLM